MEHSPQNALASLLPLLLAGEESAALAFRVLDRRRRRLRDCGRLQNALAGMGADEQRHEQLLRTWQRELPPVPTDALLLRQAEYFFSSLASRNAGLHFARIAALDSGVCLLLSALRRAQPLATLGPLWQIACDEARHVVIARDFALALAGRTERLTAVAETRAGLAGLLARQGDALATLGLDADALLRRLAHAPRCLC
jgi:hypothetical protein